MIAVRFSVDVEQRLDAMAKALGRTRSEIVREAVIRYLEREDEDSNRKPRAAAVAAARNSAIPLRTLIDHLQDEPSAPQEKLDR